jgi:putative Holliday junction resolvase
VRCLGVDLGRSRTGLALSDPLGVTCAPFGAVTEKDESRLILRIVAVADEQGVGKIVLGLPRPLSGGTNRQLEAVLSFKTRLERQTEIPVLTWDERFTSKLAARGRPRRAPHDEVAACFTLQSYLDSCTDVKGDG